MELGVTKAELIQRMSKRKITAKDFEESEPGTTVAQIHSSTSMDPAAPQNPGILLRLPLAWVLLHHGTQVFLLRSMARCI
ncbi:uncharacterized protein LOC144113803 isoform X2 [Amblyomma americanum]